MYRSFLGYAAMPQAKGDHNGTKCTRYIGTMDGPSDTLMGTDAMLASELFQPALHGIFV